jgi:predicted NBD/HSP70 family sugar kinase
LIEEKLIVFHSKGEPNSNGGPKPDLYRLNYTSRYFIGIDINMKGIIGVLMDLGGNVAGTLTMPFDMDDQAQLSGTLISLIDKLLESKKFPPHTLSVFPLDLVGLVDHRLEEPSWILTYRALKKLLESRRF